MISDKYQQLLKKYTEHGQEHVFKFFNEITEEEKKEFLTQLEEIDVERVVRIHRNLGAAKPLGKLEPIKDINTLDDGEKVADWEKVAYESIKKGEIAVITLAGGQGTRLGSSSPKGCYDIGLPSKKSLFQLQAERIIKLERLVNGIIPWYIMTSKPTHEETENFFKSNNYFGKNPETIRFFQQGVLPCLTFEGKIMLASKSSVAVAPDGNGGIFASLLKTKTLEDMKSRGVKYIHAYCVDNCLVKVGDPAFIGSTIKSKVNCACKVVEKTEPTESVGVLCKSDGNFVVAEYSEVDKETTELRDKDNKLVFNLANIANHVFSVNFLEEIDETGLGYHIAKKKIPTLDLETGQSINPTSPNGMKLELFIFDVLKRANKLNTLLVDRSLEFSPLKNAPGSDTDSPETSRRDIMNLHKSFLRNAGAILENENAECEISSLVSYNGEGLDGLKGKRITLPLNLQSIDDLNKLLF